MCVDFRSDPGPRSSSPVAMDTTEANSRTAAYCKMLYCLNQERNHQNYRC